MRRDAYGLTDKQRAFADTYLSDPRWNATNAYRSVYPNSNQKAAESGASRMLRIAKVAAYIEERQAEVLEQAKVTQQRVV